MGTRGVIAAVASLSVICCGGTRTRQPTTADDGRGRFGIYGVVRVDGAHVDCEGYAIPPTPSQIARDRYERCLRERAAPDCRGLAPSESYTIVCNGKQQPERIPRSLIKSFLLEPESHGMAVSGTIIAVLVSGLLFAIFLTPDPK